MDETAQGLSRGQEEDHNKEKKIALINDLTGFGRCSVAVQLPVISQMGVQCCVLPTSILSNHTGFDSYSFQDFTPFMEQHIAQWRRLGLSFAGICTGFLGSARQIDIVSSFIKEFATKDTCVVVDPVMGDYGRPYETYTAEMCQRMRELSSLANIITPNLTEACLLANIPYTDLGAEEALKLAEELAAQGPDHVVITGVEQGEALLNVCYEKERGGYFIEAKRIGDQRSGTGDVYAAIIATDAANGVPFATSVQKASDFVGRCVACSVERDLPLTDGICFEQVLHELR